MKSFIVHHFEKSGLASKIIKAEDKEDDKTKFKKDNKNKIFLIEKW
jgi:hypothetical protein